jgi:WD40 repeat protein
MTFDKATLLWSLPWDADWVSAVSFVGPKRVAAGNNLGEILLWDLPDDPEKTPDKPATPKPASASDKAERPLYVAPPPARRLVGHTNVVNRMLCVGGRWLISASNDHTIRFWDADAAPGSADPAKVILNARAIADATRRKNSGAKPPAPIEVQVRTQPPAKVIEGQEWIAGLSVSADGSTLIAGDDAGNVVLYDRAPGTEKTRWKVKGWAYAVALSPDLKQAAVSERFPLVFDSGRHTALKLWDLTGPAPAARFDLGKEYKDMQIAAAAYSADGRTLAVGRGGEADGTKGVVYLIDPATGKRIRELTPGHLNGLTDLCFHPDGRHLASCGRDTVVRIWSIADGKLVKELGKSRGGQFKDWIHAVSFSPDGRRLAAADMSGLVHVWSFDE